MASVKMGVAGRTALGAVFAASLVATTAGTAHAAAGESSAYGAKASLGPVTIAETVKSAFPGGPPSANLASLTLPTIGSINAIETTATGNASDGTTHSTAQTAEASVNLALATVSADAITATCDATPGSTPVGSATVTNGAATTPLGIGDITFPANPAPNTTLTLPAGLGEVILNEQIENGDGSLTVNAIHLNVASPSPFAGELVIASTTCGAGTADGGKITSAAVDQDGEQLAGVAFELRKPGATAPSCTTNGEGTCDFANLEPGTYELCVTDVPDGYGLPKPRCKEVVIDGNNRLVRFVIPGENGKKA
ncbi:prealbumin-like fold domain-containing protein [Streptomyces boluensis]|uniref:SpaA-like prealbumin fold domain-containing protein n=1 Tax=Streptomyces boluensis TaxID=1775135 RepID=A0A964URU9_9ACTN|nr:prealbumin-like fold domain-containing protein [Streptomyces boluensis]NBE53266.1 hypothetical protein [Streptomyces boluensis]